MADYRALILERHRHLKWKWLDPLEAVLMVLCGVCIGMFTLSVLLDVITRTIGAPCPYCQATGFVKSVTTVCNEIYVEMRKIAKHLEHADVMLRVNPEVAKALKAQNGKWLNEMEELTKRTIIVKSDPALHMEQFDIN